MTYTTGHFVRTSEKILYYLNIINYSATIFQINHLSYNMSENTEKCLFIVSYYVLSILTWLLSIFGFKLNKEKQQMLTI